MPSSSDQKNEPPEEPNGERAAAADRQDIDTFGSAEETAASAEPSDATEEDDDWEGVSLEELGAAYAKVMAASEGDFDHGEPADTSEEEDEDDAPTEEEAEAVGDDLDDLVTPEAIIEAALFVGHPENRPLKAKRLAALIRDVSPQEVEQTIEALNASYQERQQALRIILEDGGYKLTLAPDMEIVRRAFYGKEREARLSHGALEVLSLVAYQPGINAQKVQDQRGKESGSLLNQLVRRRLLEVHREKPDGGGRAVLTYFPTERFLNLFDLSSLDDLPQVDEADVSPSL